MLFNFSLDRNSISKEVFGLQNQNDYQKASGMQRAQMFVPNYCPFDGEIRVILEPFEWEEIKDDYPDFFYYRLDFPFGCQQNFAINTTGCKHDLLRTLAEVRVGNRRAGLVLAKPKGEFTFRYEYDGGFAATFVVGQEVIIEVCGRGFDGRSVTSGKMIGEIFRLPWTVAQHAVGMAREQLLGFRTHAATDDEYRCCREQRIADLVKARFDEAALRRRIPFQYCSPKKALLELVRGPVAYLASSEAHTMKALGAEDGHALPEYNIQGNFVKGQSQVWEFFDSRRWGSGA